MKNPPLELKGDILAVELDIVPGIGREGLQIEGLLYILYILNLIDVSFSANAGSDWPSKAISNNNLNTS